MGENENLEHRRTGKDAKKTANGKREQGDKSSINMIIISRHGPLFLFHSFSS
jgi:hypothetical protein